MFTLFDKVTTLEILTSKIVFKINFIALMEKIESEIYKNNYAENSSEAVAVLEKEENSDKTEKKIAALAEEYLSFNNNETTLENDLKDMLGKINSLEKTSPSLEFLKGQLCLELYDICKDNAKKEKNILADNFLEQANKSFLESVGDEDFEIIVKNEKGKEVTFASKSHALAYLGDIAAKDFYENGNKADWNNSLEYYQEAVRTEPDEGKKHELKIITDIRKITHYLGDENKLKVWKTPRRVDLRKATADFSLKYATDKNGIINKYIDATKRPLKEKEGWSDTAVLQLDKEITDFLAETDFDSILEEVNEKGELSGKNKELFRATLRCALATSVGLEKALKNELKNNTDSFRNDFYRSLPKLKKFLPKYSEKQIGQIMFE